ncbi:ribosome silencing factor [Haematomicrobium sanguinis]|uniref:ribosome silencing factor n=1 Tax=Haematomicrobium sanguinis TaxID=479106 RepID=UPI00047C1992|nr:ribosome silencing factor [Haematomicrobium sanguinis]
MTISEDSRTMVEVAAAAAADKLATNLLGLDVSERLALSDAFLIASAPSERQVNAIVDVIEEALSERGDKPLRREGRSEGRWVLLDYGAVVIHVMHEEDRAFYALERLWNDSPVIDLKIDGDASTGADAS